MGKTGIRGKLASLVVVALLAGCAEPVPVLPPAPPGQPVKLRPLPKQFEAAAFSVGIAKALVKFCGRDLGFNTMQERAMLEISVEQMKQQNFNDAEARLALANFDKARIQRDVFAYVEKNGIIIGEPSTFCAAGEREIARKSQIGALLFKFRK